MQHHEHDYDVRMVVATQLKSYEDESLLAGIHIQGSADIQKPNSPQVFMKTILNDSENTDIPGTPG